VSTAESPDPRAAAVARARQALRLAAADLPHLAGLAHLVRLKATSRVPVAAVAPSGLVLVNPRVFLDVPLADAAFVLAHELLHLALDTHGRGQGAPPLAVNFAHDYVINDMLTAETGRQPPLGGLSLEGARQRSLEELVAELRRGAGPRLRCWSPGGAGPARRVAGGLGDETDSPMTTALRAAGLLPPRPAPPPLPRGVARGDLLPAASEPDFEPDVGPERRRQLREQVRRAAAKAAALGALGEQVRQAAAPPAAPRRGAALLEAVRLGYAPPWQLALQRWLDAVAPRPRTFARPSRRGAESTDLIRPGRASEGWALHVLLDTSGSMVGVLPRALGAIAAFGEAANVAAVRLVQCDVEVTHDDWLDPAELAEYRVAGFGGSDMTPGLAHLANDPEVTSALVLTDGFIEFPADEPPYRVLWGLLGDAREDFAPTYGDVVRLDFGP
jgi:predicted metal-dependent peptidase